MKPTSTRARSRVLPCSSVITRASELDVVHGSRAATSRRAPARSIAGVVAQAGWRALAAAERRASTSAAVLSGTVHRSPARGGVDDLDALAAGGGDEPPIDEVVVVLHVILPEGVRNGPLPATSCTEVSVRQSTRTRDGKGSGAGTTCRRQPRACVRDSDSISLSWASYAHRQRCSAYRRHLPISSSNLVCPPTPRSRNASRGRLPGVELSRGSASRQSRSWRTIWA